MAVSDVRPPPQADLAAINAVPVTVADLLAQPLGDAAMVCLAAPARWRHAQSPDCRLDESQLLEATALARLIETGDGPGFDDVQFGALVAFLAELPW